MNKLVFTVNENNCINFLKKYPMVTHLMIQANGKNLLSAYRNFLKLNDMNESKLGGRGECIGSVSFGTKTFYKYDWDNCTGWAEVFEFVYNKNLNK